MAETRPTRKRAVSVSRRVADDVVAKRPSASHGRHAAAVLEDEAPIANYALRLTEALVDAGGGHADSDFAPRRAARPARVARTARVASTVRTPDEEDEAPNAAFALRLNAALEAISAAQSDLSPRGRDEANPRARPSGVGHELHDAPAPKRNHAALATFLKALDTLPPIRLPVGPAIPWRLALPTLAVLVAVMAFASRPAPSTQSQADLSQASKLPTQQTYPVQLEAPLFANAPQAEAQAPAPTDAPAPPAAQPLGVQEPAGMGFDVLDVGLKLAAVLGLAYGSLMLLKKAGIGGGATVLNKGGATIHGLRVVSSLVLAPNRSVHVLKVPGGKTLLVGVTPTAVNLIADLGDLDDDDATPEPASLLHSLKSKIGS